MYTKGQSVERFRFLRRQGGFVQVFTQSTALDANGHITTSNPSVIICRHHVINVYDTDEIVAGIQLGDDGSSSESSFGSTSSSDLSSPQSSEAGSPPAYPDYLNELGPISPGRLETELDAMDLVPADEMHMLDIYLQQHLASCDEDFDEFGYGQLQSNTMMELTSW